MVPPVDAGASDGRRRTALAAARWLADLLAAGPRDSRDIMAVGAGAGMTPKALRRARESLALKVVRTGVRQTMRSVWALPGQAERTGGTTEAAIETPFTDGERLRTARRVAYFQTKGMNERDSTALAECLVLERDRLNELRFEASCAECQNLGTDGSCRAQREGTGVSPRPANVVWYCWCARRAVA